MCHNQPHPSSNDLSNAICIMFDIYLLTFDIIIHTVHIHRYLQYTYVYIQVHTSTYEYIRRLGHRLTVLSMSLQPFHFSLLLVRVSYDLCFSISSVSSVPRHCIHLHEYKYLSFANFSSIIREYNTLTQ